MCRIGWFAVWIFVHFMDFRKRMDLIIRLSKCEILAGLTLVYYLVLLVDLSSCLNGGPINGEGSGRLVMSGSRW